MTDQIDHETDDKPETATTGINRRRMFLAGAGIAGAAVITKAGSASAATEPVDTEQDNLSELTTTITNSGTSTTRDNNAFKGVISNTGNNSHSILGTTVGGGHAIAGVVGTDAAAPDPAVAATWGLQWGNAAAVEGDNRAADVPIAGPANGVKGIVVDPTNGSHAVLGTTEGQGHAIAGVSNNLDADPGDGTGAKAATWGRHFGPAAAVEGQSKTASAPIAGPANGVKGIVDEPGNGSHAVLGVTNGGGHSIAGDTPADAKGKDGTGENVVAATWGRHQGNGAGIGGISVGGYGGEFVGGKASARLIPSENAPVGAPTDAMHLVGELFVDGAGDLYYNTADGANFTRLNNQGGMVILPDSQRAYDSREGSDPANSNKGRHAAEEVREIDLTEFTDLPASAQGAIINLTVAQTDANGFAFVYNGDSDDGTLGSSINWVDAGEFIANGITVAVGASGTVKVYTLVATEVVIDVVGYVT